MIHFPAAISRLIAISMLVGIFAALAGCGNMGEMVKQQQDYNRRKCQDFGLYPGSNAYIQCINDGADVYAQSHKDIGNDRPSWGGRPRNNACDARASTPNGSCAGCSVSCTGDKQASCQQGQEWPGGSPTCMRNAVCECR